MAEKTTLEVFTVVPASTEGGRDYWHRVGSAWVNRDRSLTVRLNSLPLNGELIIKKPRERTDSSREESSRRGGR